MSAAAHPLFAKAPLGADVILSTGPAPTPYHVYDGHGLIVLGTCDAAALQACFAGQDVHPVTTKAGKGILIVFVCDFAHASHGPHTELHITALAAPEQGARLPDDPSAALAALATRPDWGVLSLHLWNDQPAVVAYNTEYLGLGAQLHKAEITQQAGRLRFGFEDASGAPLLSGDVPVPARSDARLMVRVIRHLGVKGFWDAARKKIPQAFVINRKSDVIARNGRAKTYTMADKMVVAPFDPARHSMAFADGPLGALGFCPQILEHLWPFRFIYLHPDES